MAKYKKHLVCEDCPNCGDSLYVFTDCGEENDTEFEQFVQDGDLVKCAGNCGFESAMDVDENGAWVQDGNLEDLAD